MAGGVINGEKKTVGLRDKRTSGNLNDALTREIHLHRDVASSIECTRDTNVAQTTIDGRHRGFAATHKKTALDGNESRAVSNYSMWLTRYDL